MIRFTLKKKYSVATYWKAANRRDHFDRTPALAVDREKGERRTCSGAVRASRERYRENKAVSGTSLYMGITQISAILSFEVTKSGNLPCQWSAHQDGKQEDGHTGQ